MVATGIDAARDVQVQLADLAQVVQIVELALNGFGDGDGDRVGQRAEVSAGTGDDVGQQADVGRGQVQRFQLLPEFVQPRTAHVGQYQVLLVRDAQFAAAIGVGQVGYGVHLVGGDPATLCACTLVRSQRAKRLSPAASASVLSVSSAAAASYCGQTKRALMLSTNSWVMVSGPPLRSCPGSSACGA
ncbi:hypothetical protein G6F57_020777 [Rhizopus arrhizus]|nr:hypothetical protein G6F57_020777 [Rhizopus arrhizus]